VPDGCSVDSIVWYENGEALNLAYAPRFVAGNTYRVEVTLIADNGVKFANPLTSTEISYKKATVSPYGGNAQKGIVMSVDFGTCPNVVPQVDLTVTAPKEGNKPSYTIGCGSDAYYAVGGSSNYTDYRQWYESSDGEVWWKIDTSSKFAADYYYKFVVDIRTNNGYEFPVYDNGSSIVPDVSATVNGYYAKVIKAYDQDPSRYITVEYNFGECNDSVVNSIIVENVTAPVAGERPTYTYSIRGSGYQMNTAKNAYEDIYWKNPPEQWYYIKNGIGWYDLTKNDWVYEHETFIPGHEYQVRVYLKTEDGYEFAHTKSYEPTVTATVNGNTAVPITTGSDCTWYQQVQYTFTCAQQEISTIMISLDAPQAGKTPAEYTGTTAYPDLYQISEYNDVQYLYWYDADGMILDSDQEFVRGERYTAEIKVVPTKNNGMDMCRFNNVTAYVNGKKVEARVGALNDGVMANSTVAYITYTFTDGGGASAPEIEIYAFLSQPKGGEVFVGEALNVNWETTFVPTQTEIQYWDGEDWDQWDVQEAENKRDDYDFENVDAETVRFRIAAYVGNDIVATSSEFTVTWKPTAALTSNGTSHTVTLKRAEAGVSVLAVSYDNHGMMTGVVTVTTVKPETLTGDSVKVFFVHETTSEPVRAHLES